ncbi:MAG: hypothetical protein K2O95_00855 [Clostridia bacterium]|nr:hypothetical protein [Clostridia bacterium]
MILSQSLTQPYALLVFSLLGISFGVIYMLNWFFCAFMIKSRIYRHISQILYALVYGICFFLCVGVKFQYNLHIYHFSIAIFTTIVAAIIIYIPIRKKRNVITEKCAVWKQKISKSKLAQKIKK